MEDGRVARIGWWCVEKRKKGRLFRRATFEIPGQAPIRPSLVSSDSNDLDGFNEIAMGSFHPQTGCIDRTDNRLYILDSLPLVCIAVSYPHSHLAADKPVAPSAGNNRAPGFMNPVGSSCFLIPRSRLTVPAPSSLSKYSLLPLPTPCSPVAVPPRS